jgi:hypothetical protein
MNHGFTVLFVDSSGERTAHRANLDAILRIAAVSDAILSNNSLQSFVASHLTRRIHIEKPHLRNGLRTNVIVFIILWASLETTTARHATGVGITLLNVFLVHPRSGTEIVMQIGGRLSRLGSRVRVMHLAELLAAT